MGARILCIPISGLSPLCMALLSRNARPEQASRAIGNAQALQWVGTVAGPLIGGAVGSLVGLRGTYVISAALYVIAIVGFTLLADDRHLRVAPGNRRDRSGWGLLALPNVATLAAVLFTIQFVDKSFAPTLPVLVRSLEGDPARTVALTGVITAAGALAIALASFAAPRLEGRISAPHLLLGAALWAMVMCLPVPVANAWWQLLALRALLGLPVGLLVTSMYAIAGRCTPPQQRAATLGVVASGSMCGNAVGPLLAGFLAAHTLGGVFLCDALLYATCALMLTRLRHAGRVEAVAAARP